MTKRTYLIVLKKKQKRKIIMKETTNHSMNDLDFGDALNLELQKLQKQRRSSSLEDRRSSYSQRTTSTITSFDAGKSSSVLALSDQKTLKIPLTLSHWDSVDQTCKLGKVRRGHLGQANVRDLYLWVIKRFQIELWILLSWCVSGMNVMDDVWWLCKWREFIGLIKTEYTMHIRWGQQDCWGHEDHEGQIIMVMLDLWLTVNKEKKNW